MRLKRNKFKIGDKVGIIEWNPNLNKEKLENGIIVGKKVFTDTYMNGELPCVHFEVKYAVRIRDGQIRIVKENEMWKEKEFKDIE